MMPAQGARVAAMPGGIRSAGPITAGSVAHSFPHYGHPVAGVRPIGPARVAPHGTAIRTSLSAAGLKNHPSTASSLSKSRHNTNQFGSTFYEDETNVPGLGFDYVHFAAVHPNGVGARHRFVSGGSVVPFLGGGIYMPIPYYVEQPAEEAPAAEPADTSEELAEADAPRGNTIVRRSAAPLPETSSEYVFVRKDGTMFFAVAYSWNAGSLQYVTKEGLRRSVPLSTLDLDATQQFNEQRGITVRLPA